MRATLQTTKIDIGLTWCCLMLYPVSCCRIVSVIYVYLYPYSNSGAVSLW